MVPNSDQAKPDASRQAMLSHISHQLVDLVAKIEGDVTANRDDASGVPGGGFIAYSLMDRNGEPLRDFVISAHDLDTEALEGCEGYRQFESRCRQLGFKMRLDQHFYAAKPTQTKILRVVVDGW
ncbi:MAG: hypothetical protein HOL85_17500 [Rhodospirillaceae bacterium]|jgi:hypothetical protein|nr:hypothetical protein [Rhodospirillaceae bacterium]MBT6136037.1 hypothetical protein [Rhodospirillaceae bacterium]